MSNEESTKESRPDIKSGIDVIGIKKATVQPIFRSKTVLTDSTWQYVEMLFKNKKCVEALNYWTQAKNFFIATENLDLLSRPLTSYYCFLNATKALLVYKKIHFDLKHGVSGRRANGHKILQNELASIQPKGVLSGLCFYLREPIQTYQAKKLEDGSEREVTKTLCKEYSLKSIFYNLEYIHRAYCLTFSNQTELFIPLDNIRLVYDKSRKEGWMEAKLEKQYSNKSTLNKLHGFSLDNYYNNYHTYIIRRNKTFIWDVKSNHPTKESIESLLKYHFNLRKRLRYIYSPSKLWYIKRDNLNNIIHYSSLILTYMAMHRLSELSRYNPNELNDLLTNSQGWLVSEFINKSIYQFIDMISSEITGDDFRVTGFRT